MNDRNLALKISKHPLIRRLLETKMATSSIVARLIVEELMVEEETAYNQILNKIANAKKLQDLPNPDEFNNQSITREQSDELKKKAIAKAKKLQAQAKQAAPGGDQETESAPEEFEVLMRSAIELSQEDKIKGFNKLQMLVAATLKVFFARELQENVTVGDIIQGLLQKITGNKQINSNSLAKYIDFLKYIGKSIPAIKEETPYEVLQFLLEKPENQDALQKYVTGQEKDSTPKSTSKVSPVGLFMRMGYEEEEAKAKYKQIKGEVVDELKGEESATPEQIKNKVEEKVPTEVPSEKKEQIAIAATEEIIDERELEVSEKEAGIDPQDKDQPDYFDLTPDQKEDLLAAAKEFINEFYEKQYLYEQGVLTKNMLSTILRIKSGEEKEKAAKMSKGKKINKLQEVEEDKVEASKGRLRSIQIAFRTFLREIKATNKAMKDFAEVAESGSIVASSKKKKFIQLLQRQQRDIVSLHNGLSMIMKNTLDEDEGHVNRG